MIRINDCIGIDKVCDNTSRINTIQYNSNVVTN